VESLFDHALKGKDVGKELSLFFVTGACPESGYQNRRYSPNDPKRDKENHPCARRFENQKGGGDA
jgi:hypothetical protein